MKTEEREEKEKRKKEKNLCIFRQSETTI